MATTQVTRRALVAGAGALTAIPAVAASPKAKTTSFTNKALPVSAIETLWHDAETLRTKLVAHRASIAEAAQNGGIAGWMRLGGEANQLGEARYGKLMTILRSEPEIASDLAIMARVILDDDVRTGALSWAAERLAHATLSFHGNQIA